MPPFWAPGLDRVVVYSNGRRLVAYDAGSGTVLHRPNIARLRSGTESRFRFRRTAEPLA